MENAFVRTQPFPGNYMGYLIGIWLIPPSSQLFVLFEQLYGQFVPFFSLSEADQGVLGKKEIEGHFFAQVEKYLFICN